MGCIQCMVCTPLARLCVHIISPLFIWHLRALACAQSCLAAIPITNTEWDVMVIVATITNTQWDAMVTVATTITDMVTVAILTLNLNLILNLHLVGCLTQAC